MPRPELGPKLGTKLGPKLGLALGSGSARGWSHIGVLEVLAEAGIEPDIVCGCSIGSLVGAAYVAGQLPRLKEFALSLTWREIARLLDVKLSTGGLIGGADVITLLRRLDIDKPIPDYEKPFAAVATDLDSGREVWLREGPIEEAVRASISLPGIFSPVAHAGRWLVDGGLVNPVPVSVCRALGADIVVAVNLNGDLVGRIEAQRRKSASPNGSGDFVARLVEQMPLPLRVPAAAILPKLGGATPSLPGYFDVLMGSINVMQDQITRARMAGEPPHVSLVPRLGDVKLLEFNRAAEIIAEGRACAEAALPVIKRYLGE